ncbi:MAG: hypothetical protein K5770_03970 [Lachnospiraceae bacterium]|nr:hypothetical protein [Lachnospiraceae bacterium]
MTDKIVSKEKIEEKIRQMNTELSDDQMAAAGGGVDDGTPEPKYHVGDIVHLVDGDDGLEQITIIKQLSWSPDEGWWYLIKAYMPEIGWIEPGAVCETYIYPA